MNLTPESILWIKNVNAENGAYFDTGKEFRLHFPNNHQMNASQPEVGDAILLFQKISTKHVFTHIVTPFSREVKKEAGREKFKYYREVTVLAKRTRSPFIERRQTLFRDIGLRGVSQGNVCRLDNVKEIIQQKLLKEIQLELFAHFLPETEIGKSDIEDEELFAEEGNRILLIHYAYERNRKLALAKKTQAIRAGCLRCEVCDFSFPDKYGQEFIECHHRTPLGAGIVRNTKLEDLYLVCSNCHRMLHRKIDGEYLNTEQLKALIRKK
ncbi:MAG: HNH endonuclease [Candidatus Thorarchaeota archaeon]